MSPQEAEREMVSRGRKVAWRAIHDARERERAKVAREAREARSAQAPPVALPPSASAPAIQEKRAPKEVLAQYVKLAGMLPADQQEELLAALPIYRRQREAVAIAVARYPDAALAVARALESR